MKVMKNINEYNDKEWEELASLLEGEQNEKSDLLSRFMAEDSHNTINYWKELREMDNEKEINVDKAWDKLYSRLNYNGLITKSVPVQRNILRSTFVRIAAAALVLLSVGSVLMYLGSKGTLSRKVVVTTADNQKNLQVTLPDGSNIFLNRNTRLSYRENFGRHNRNVSLSGEAFFEIEQDISNPFTVDAGKARVKVVGTSFNVITNNADYAVEVFVKAGKVVLTNNSGSNNIELDPGFIGTMDSQISGKSMNIDPNYLAWNTGLLVYDGQKLDVVFRDLKRVYNMEIVADNPEILEKPWTSPIDNMPQETIIRLICASFNLSYTKDGNVYHLAVK
jgi:ferric-dicitrate binding protein FerR (iron transport regulator)